MTRIMFYISLFTWQESVKQNAKGQEFGKQEVLTTLLPPLPPMITM